MGNLPLILIDYSKREVTHTEAALEEKRVALETASFLQKVSNADQNNNAVLVLKRLKEFTSAVEKARKQAKEPVLELGKKVDALAEELSADVQSEYRRVTNLVNGFHMIEHNRIALEEKQRQQALAKAEEERRKAIDAAANTAEREEVNAEFAAKTEALAPAPIPTRAEGQVVREEWEFEIVDPFLLIKMHPQFVNPKKLAECFSRLDIKDALKSGVTVHGIIAKKTVVSSVRL
jgi:hypothetical protein